MWLQKNLPPLFWSRNVQFSGGFDPFKVCTMMKLGRTRVWNIDRLVKKISLQWQQQQHAEFVTRSDQHKGDICFNFMFILSQFLHFPSSLSVRPLLLRLYPIDQLSSSAGSSSSSTISSGASSCSSSATSITKFRSRVSQGITKICSAYRPHRRRRPFRLRAQAPRHGTATTRRHLMQ